MKISIIVPAYNEEKKIKETLINIKNKFPDSNIIVIDDGSIDNTYNEAKGSGVYVLRHIINRGQGASLQTGNDFALKLKSDILVHFDGDGQHIVDDIENLIKAIKKYNVDVVLGSRFLKTQSDIPISKKFFILKPAILINYFFTGVKLTDAHNGLRALTASAAKKIKITQDRMAHNTEIIAEIKKNKLNYKEIPVEIIYTEYGQGIFSGVEIIKDLIFKKIL